MDSPNNQPAPTLTPSALPAYPAIIYTAIRPPGGYMYLIGVGLAGVGAVLLCARVLLPRSDIDFITIGFGFLIIGLIAGVPGYLMHRTVMDPLRRRFAGCLPADNALTTPPTHVQYPDLIGAILFDSGMAECGSAMLSIGEPGQAWKEVRQRAYRLGVPLPRCVVAEKLEAGCRAIPLTADLLEPEEIASLGRSGNWRFFLFRLLMLSFLATYAWRVRQWLVLGVSVFLLFSLLSSRFRWLRWDKIVGGGTPDPIAGCGVIKDHQGRRLASPNSTMLVQSLRSSSSPIVTIFGETGMLSMTFSSPKDADFIKLWQRWNHLDPKPDILE
jgi:hypothetical protein